MNHRKEVTAEKKFFISMISCKLHIFCAIWEDYQNTVYLFPNTEAASMDFPQAEEKAKHTFPGHRADNFLASGMQDPKLPWHISCTLRQNSTGRNSCLTSLSTDNTHNKHMGCISVARRAGKFLIYFILSEARSILWLKGPLKTQAYVQRLFYHHGKKCIQRSVALRLRSVRLQPSSGN